MTAPRITGLSELEAVELQASLLDLAGGAPWGERFLQALVADLRRRAPESPCSLDTLHPTGAR